MNPSDEFDADMYRAAFDPNLPQEHTFPCRLRSNAISAGIETDHTNCMCWCHE